MPPQFTTRQPTPTPPPIYVRKSQIYHHLEHIQIIPLKVINGGEKLFKFFYQKKEGKGLQGKFSSEFYYNLSDLSFIDSA
jgi:hypothetical protein